MSENNFFKFSSGVLFNIRLFYLQNFSWCQQRKFHLKRDWSKEHKVYHLQWISSRATAENFPEEGGSEKKTKISTI